MKSILLNLFHVKSKISLFIKEMPRLAPVQQTGLKIEDGRNQKVMYHRGGEGERAGCKILEICTV